MYGGRIFYKHDSFIAIQSDIAYLYSFIFLYILQTPISTYTMQNSHLYQSYYSKHTNMLNKRKYSIIVYVFAFRMYEINCSFS